MPTSKRSFLHLLSSGLASAVIIKRLFHNDGVPVAAAPAAKPGSVSQVPPTARQPHVSSPKPSSILDYLKITFARFNEDDCTTMAAALSYNTIFSLPPLLLVIISLVGLVFGRKAVQGQIQQQIQDLIGGGAGTQVATMVRSAGQHSSSGKIGMVVGILVLLSGATGVFLQLQESLNRLWHVKPDPHAGGIKNFVTKRVLSLGMVAGVAFLLLVSLAVSAALSALGGMMSSFLPSAFSGTLVYALEVVISLVIIAVLFAAIFKVVPDVKVEWRQVWVGAVATAGLFTIGKFLIGYYLGKSGAATAYGAAAALVIIVLWIYYASIIFLLGAAFTSVWAAAHGSVRPQPGAIRVVEREEQIESSDSRPEMLRSRERK